MSFNPTLPVANSPITSAELRNQFNALKALMDALDARVTALEPPPLTASGFAAAGANGLLTQVGTINGQPLYQAAGGWYFGWMGDPPGWWAVQSDDPRVTGFNGIYYREDAAVTGQYVIGGTSNPAGTVA